MRAPILAVVALALLAGCGGFVGSAPEETVTPAPVPEPTTQPRTGSAIAPGVAGGAVVDADRLARAHRAAIQNRSYRWSQQHRSTQFNGNGSMVTTTRLWVQHERLYRYQLSTSWTAVNTSEYTAGQIRYRRELGRAGFRYEIEESAPVTARFGDQAVVAIRRYLSIGDARIVATRVDGQRYYRIMGTTDSIPVTGEISNYSVRALVAPSGFVRSISVDYDDVIGGSREQIHYEYEYAGVGETRVDPPAWIGERWPENTTTPTPETVG